MLRHFHDHIWSTTEAERARSAGDVTSADIRDGERIMAVCQDEVPNGLSSFFSSLSVVLFGAYCVSEGCCVFSCNFMPCGCRCNGAIFTLEFGVGCVEGWKDTCTAQGSCWARGAPGSFVPSAWDFDK
ncbi:hypothetical protein NPIL_648011 [Nephila pilipes]|uniref:Uncharacterized protein n=1 Tax=Nephila pilipes TaxID=299642 RepID=A0A8X6UW01_NEPPI|nr:hypothetical protein NPIL_648011 [Nephila pilipes]